MSDGETRRRISMTAPIPESEKEEDEEEEVSSSSAQQEDDANTTKTTTDGTSVMLQRQNAIKVIKGEIHNVLTVMRTDARYASPMRFVDEIWEHDEMANNNNNSTDFNNNNNNNEHHPLLGSLRELHEQLSVWSLENPLEVAMYLTPFCTAISGREISASVTGCALSALHKMVLYGFLDGSTEGMTLVAKSLLHCTFEESAHGRSGSLGGGASAVSSSLNSSSNNNNNINNNTSNTIINNNNNNPRSSFGSMMNASSRHLQSRRSLTTTSTTGGGLRPNDDEQVVLKLVSLAALVVRCSLDNQDQPLIDTSLVVGLLDTCLHVSHRARHASGLLRSAAGDALAQIVLVVFHAHALLTQARATILSQLAGLVHPTTSPEACVTSLTLLNIALETMETATPAEIQILHNDLCKHLLHWSTTNDLVVLSLTLRVIFNLFQNTLRNQMKVPLEIFLTSVHMRILLDKQPTTTNNSSNNNAATSSKAHNLAEQREVVLESLLEFCQEPSLLQDIYLNYDCDMNCTNLFESICQALSTMATPEPGCPVNALNKVALEGMLAVLDSVARKCDEGERFAPHDDDDNKDASSKDDARVETMSDLSEGSELMDDNDDDDDVQANNNNAPSTTDKEDANHNNALDTAAAMNEWMMHASYDDLGARWKAEETHKVLQERKRQKHVKQQVAQEFNNNNPDWIRVGQDMELFPSSDQYLTPTHVAQFLYSTSSSLDKTQMGLYLSKGPEEQYPFHAQVRSAFCAVFDFTDMSFADALRTFLSKFRLPGEAQCIDRLMEAFSTELFQQELEHSQGSRRGSLVFQPEGEEDNKQDHSKKEPLFRSADAVFRMAFSTIMLNTDLHNPGMKDERRMTLDDFIRNNRGLNDDNDFPRAFLEDLYNQIRTQELRVQIEFDEVLRRHAVDGEIPAKHWEGILQRRIEAPFFTPAEAAHSRIYQAGVHDRDMFVSIAKKATECITSIFVRSMDDLLVIKTLRGLQQMTKICVYFDLDETFNDILQVLLGHGRDYIMSCIALEYAGYDSEHIMSAGPDVHESSEYIDSNTPPMFVGGLGDSTSNMSGSAPASMPVPQDVLQRSLSFSKHHRMTRAAAEGSAAHRGLLALDCGFTLIRTQPSRLREAWPTLIECLCALRDARALPDRVIFLDDFADSRGNLLPLSPFAKQSQRRLDEYYKSLSSHNMKRKGWFASLLTSTTNLVTGDSNKNQSANDTSTATTVEGTTVADVQNEKELSYFSKALLQVTKRAKLEQVVLMRPKNLPLAKQTVRALLDAIDAYPYFDDPIFEQHAVYSLELALLALISNRDRVAELYPLFLSKFDGVLHGGSTSSTTGGGGGSGDNEITEQSEKNLPTPFLMERVVVSILRSCIHLYDIPDVRPQLRTSLHLLMDLPPSFTRYVADRIACGMAIFLSQKFALLESNNEWSFIGDMLDNLSHYGPGRGFVFDGIANTVESQLAPTSQVGDVRPVLSLDGSAVMAKLLLKFVFGTYQKDMSLSVPAMMCLENLYRHTVLMRRATDDDDDEEEEVDVNQASSSSFVSVTEGKTKFVSAVPDKALWQNVAVAFYSVCRSSDSSASRQGTDCFQRFIASTKMDSLPDDTWLTMLHLIVMKQPPVSAEEARVNCCAILGKVLLMTIAHLSDNRGNWEDLTDIVNQMAVLVGENLREGRRGTVSPLFESTLLSITFLSNHLVSENFTGDKEYGTWVSDTLLFELEKVGAGGGSIKNVAAITKQPSTPQIKPPTEDRESPKTDTAEQEETTGEAENNEPVEDNQ